VHGPVAADGDEQVRVCGGFAGERGEVPGPLREQGVAVQPGRGRPVRELRPAAAGRAVLGGRVDEKDDALNGIR
jgi:hypothetical protein